MAQSAIKSFTKLIFFSSQLTDKNIGNNYGNYIKECIFYCKYVKKINKDKLSIGAKFLTDKETKVQKN